jgi:hypothetical protein
MGPGVMDQTQVRFLERRMDHDFEQIQNDSSTNMNSLQGDRMRIIDWVAEEGVIHRFQNFTR